MPTYQYACTECGHAFDQFQSFSDDALSECPVCEGRLRKVFNAVGVVFKGSGFYRNDSREPAPAASGNGSSDKSGSEKSTSSSDSDSGSASGSGSSSGSGEGGSGAAKDGKPAKPAKPSPSRSKDSTSAA